MSILATLGGKLGAGFLGVALIAGMIWAYNESLRSEGREEILVEQREQIEEQVEAVQEHDKQQIKGTILTLEAMAKATQAFNDKLLQSNKSKDRSIEQLQAKLTKAQNTKPEVEYVYVPHVVEVAIERETPCVVPDDLLDRMDELTGVLDTIPYHRMSGNPGAPGGDQVSGSSPVTCASYITRLEVVASRLGNSLIKHRSQTEWAMDQYRKHQAFKAKMKDTE